MKNWAIYDKDHNLINLLIADTKEIAEEVSGESAMEYDQSIDLMDLSWIWNGEKFIDPSAVDSSTPE